MEEIELRDESAKKNLTSFLKTFAEEFGEISHEFNPSGRGHYFNEEKLNVYLPDNRDVLILKKGDSNSNVAYNFIKEIVDVCEWKKNDKLEMSYGMEQLYLSFFEDPSVF